MKADHHIGHLHAGVVDVVLHFHVMPAARSMRTNVSPRIALRRWPMCAALLGLMLVCSTMILPASRGASLRSAATSAARAHKRRGRSRILMYPLPATSSRRTGDWAKLGHQFRRQSSSAPASTVWPAGKRRAPRSRRKTPAWAARAPLLHRRHSGSEHGRETTAPILVQSDETLSFSIADCLITASSDSDGSLASLPCAAQPDPQAWRMDTTAIRNTSSDQRASHPLRRPGDVRNRKGVVNSTPLAPANRSKAPTTQPPAATRASVAARRKILAIRWSRQKD